MKKQSAFLSLIILFLVSCSGGDSYTIETFYSENKGDNDTTLSSKKDVIKAESDSAAFLKAQEKFNELLSSSGDKNGMPVKFTLRNSEDVIIAGPGQGKIQQIEKDMYPNQKP